MKNCIRDWGKAIIGITGFDGGKLKKISDININIDSVSYEQIEDMHIVITNIIVYWFKISQKKS